MRALSSVMVDGDDAFIVRTVYCPVAAPLDTPYCPFLYPYRLANAWYCVNVCTYIIHHFTMDHYALVRIPRSSTVVICDL